MRDPGPIGPVAGLALLVLPHRRQRSLSHRGLAPVGYEGAHAADGVRTACVTGPHQQLLVSAHEGHGHGHLSAIRQDLVCSRMELLDDAEDVIPAAGVEARGVVPQLVQDLVHLECGQDGLDQHGGANRPSRNAQRLLCRNEDVVPETRLEVRLELGKVEVRTGPAVELLASVVEEGQPKVEEARGDGSSVHQHVPLIQMPAARANDQRRQAFVEGIRLLIGLEGELMAHRFPH